MSSRLRPALPDRELDRGSNADDRYRPASSEQASPRIGSQTGAAMTGVLGRLRCRLGGRVRGRLRGRLRRDVRPGGGGPARRATGARRGRCRVLASVPVGREGGEGLGRRPAGRWRPRPRSATRRPRPDRRLAWVTRDGRRGAADPAVPRPGVLARTVGSVWPTIGSRNPAIAAPLEKRDSGSGASARRRRRPGRPARRRARPAATAPACRRGRGRAGRACRRATAGVRSAPRTSPGPGRRCPRPASSRPLRLLRAEVLDRAHVVPGAPSASAASRAIPKSVMSARPSRASRMLPGFTSRWTIPRMCATPRAREMSSPSRATSATDRAPCVGAWPRDPPRRSAP